MQLLARKALNYIFCPKDVKQRLETQFDQRIRRMSVS